MTGEHGRRFGVAGRGKQPAVGFRAAFHPLGGELDPGQLGQGRAGLRKRLGGTHPRHHPLEPRRQRGAGDAQLGVLGHHAATAARAVVVGPPELDRSQHRVEVLVPVGDEGGLVAGSAVDAGAAVPGVHRQQVLKQRGAQLGHGGPDGQLDRAQAVGSATEGVRGQGGQAGYLRGELLLEAGEEPPLSSPASTGGASSASADTGRASQIASFTSAIWWVSATKRW